MYCNVSNYDFASVQGGILKRQYIDRPHVVFRSEVNVTKKVGDLVLSISFRSAATANIALLGLKPQLGGPTIL